VTYFVRVISFDRAKTDGPVLATASVAIPVSADEDLILHGIVVLRHRGGVRIGLPGYFPPGSRERTDAYTLPVALERAIRNAVLAAWRDQEAEPVATAWGVPLPERYRARA
jgi:DNA-binding cell septation regulator SpoVG